MSYKTCANGFEKLMSWASSKLSKAGLEPEIGALSVLASKHKENSPALLFDDIKDYPSGFRIHGGFLKACAARR